MTPYWWPAKDWGLAQQKLFIKWIVITLDWRSLKTERVTLTEEGIYNKNDWVLTHIHCLFLSLFELDCHSKMLMQSKRKSALPLQSMCRQRLHSAWLKQYSFWCSSLLFCYNFFLHTNFSFTLLNTRRRKCVTPCFGHVTKQTHALCTFRSDPSTKETAEWVRGNSSGLFI